MSLKDTAVETTDTDTEFAELKIWLDDVVQPIYVSGCTVVSDSQTIKAPYPKIQAIKFALNEGGQMYTKPSLDPVNLF